MPASRNGLALAAIAPWYLCKMYGAGGYASGVGYLATLESYDAAAGSTICLVIFHMHRVLDVALSCLQIRGRHTTICQQVDLV